MVYAGDAEGVVPPAARGLQVRGGGSRGKGSGERGSGAPSYARSPPHDGVLYEELEVHWASSARYSFGRVLIGV